MIKVCHIVNLITGQADGVYAHLKMIFKNADRSKFEHILIFQGGGKIESETKELGIKVFVSKSLKKKISIKAFLDIHRILKENNIDIIHTHLIKPYSIAGLLNIFLKKRFIFNYHGIFLKNNLYYSFIERTVYSAVHYLIYLFGKVDAVLVPSRKSKELLMSETKLFPEPIVYYNGNSSNSNVKEPDPQLLNRFYEIKKHKFIISVVGRLEIDKRVDRAIELIERLIVKGRFVHLIVSGEGSLKNELQNLVRKLNLSDHIDFLGYVPDLQNYYKFFDIVLFTSDWEGMPLTVWEAMANEVPIVAPDVGGFKEILEENKCGLIYEARNTEQAEKLIIQLIDDDQLRKTLGKNAKAALGLKYNDKKFIMNIENIYSQLSYKL